MHLSIIDFTLQHQYVWNFSLIKLLKRRKTINFAKLLVHTSHLIHFTTQRLHTQEQEETGGEFEGIPAGGEG